MNSLRLKYRLLWSLSISWFRYRLLYRRFDWKNLILLLIWFINNIWKLNKLYSRAIRHHLDEKTVFWKFLIFRSELRSNFCWRLSSKLYFHLIFLLHFQIRLWLKISKLTEKLLIHRKYYNPLKNQIWNNLYFNTFCKWYEKIFI